ncbi:MAG: hypothetical protein JWM95_1437 [Gemmatimonadetes bacterium]|nr:hypothetical protein [Gemmatimonadota bacterium]
MSLKRVFFGGALLALLPCVASAQQFESQTLEIQSTTTPEPATVVLLGTGLAAVIGVTRRRRK